MHLNKSSCILCEEYIQRIQYNLKTTYSETSQVLLIKFVEKMYSNIFLMHCNICSKCYEMLNELDNIQERQKELNAQLKMYISKLAAPAGSSQSSPYIDQNMNENTSKTVKEEVSDIDDTFWEIEDIDLKKLPIKIKKVTTTTTGVSKEKAEATAKPNTDEGNGEDKEKLFEKIQALIQLDLSKHVKNHLEKSKPFKDILCEICGQNFKTKLGYDNHVKKHGDEEDDMKLLAMNKTGNDWTCQVCNKTFTQKVALRRHVAIHTGETRYQCEECGKKFLHHSSFTMHRKIHADEKNYICHQCNKAFLSNSHLKRHMRAIHSNEKQHKCTICGKKFTENYNLTAHFKVCHSVNLGFTQPVVLEEFLDTEEKIFGVV